MDVFKEVLLNLDVFGEIELLSERNETIVIKVVPSSSNLFGYDFEIKTVNGITEQSVVMSTINEVRVFLKVKHAMYYSDGKECVKMFIYYRDTELQSLGSII